MKHRMNLSATELALLRKRIAEKTGYPIPSSCVLNQTFRRRSFCAEGGGKSNEMFEFLGDRIISFYVMKRITHHCCTLNMEGDYAFRIREDRASDWMQQLVSNELLAEIIDEWEVAEYLLMSRSDVNNLAHQQTKVKADLFEAVIGALAISYRWDPEVLESAVVRALNLDDRIEALIRADVDSSEFNLENAVTTLKEMAEREQCSMPQYHFDGPEHLGYDENGDPVWCCSASMVNDVTGITRTVFASSKRDAKRAAAYLLLCEHFQTQNQYGINDFYKIWRYRDGKLMPDRMG